MRIPVLRDVGLENRFREILESQRQYPFRSDAKSSAALRVLGTNSNLPPLRFVDFGPRRRGPVAHLLVSRASHGQLIATVTEVGECPSIFWIFQTDS